MYLKGGPIPAPLSRSGTCPRSPSRFGTGPWTPFRVPEPVPPFAFRKRHGPPGRGRPVKEAIGGVAGADKAPKITDAGAGPATTGRDPRSWYRSGPIVHHDRYRVPDSGSNFRDHRRTIGRGHWRYACGRAVATSAGMAWAGRGRFAGVVAGGAWPRRPGDERGVDFHRSTVVSDTASPTRPPGPNRTRDLWTCHDPGEGSAVWMRKGKPSAASQQASA